MAYALFFMNFTRGAGFPFNFLDKNNLGGTIGITHRRIYTFAKEEF